MARATESSDRRNLSRHWPRTLYNTISAWTNSKPKVIKLLQPVQRMPKSEPIPIPRTKSGPPVTFLNLPVEIRIQIYNYFQSDAESLSRPTTHPFYPFLFICRTIRLDITNIFYTQPIFSFFAPHTCLNFLMHTKSHTHLLTALTLHLRNTKTHTLEPIFKELVERGAPLRHLTIYLNFKDEHAERERIVTAYMLPRRIGISEEGKRRREKWRTESEFWGNRWMGKCEPPEFGKRGNFVYAHVHNHLAVSLAENCGSWLGRMGKVRYVAVHGQPEDAETDERLEVDGKQKGVDGKGGAGERKPEVGKALDFELGILNLHLKMQKAAKKEGKLLDKWRGCQNSEDRFWFYKCFIEGEELEVPKDW